MFGHRNKIKCLPPVFDSSTVWGQSSPVCGRIVIAVRWSGVGVSEMGHETGLERLLRTVFLSKEAGSGTLPGWQAELSAVPLAGCGGVHVPVGQAPQ